MFRSRFTEAFPKSLANFGPQELERDIVDIVPGELAENFLCAVLGLLLNRKQDIKPGHYSRALEEAVQTHKSQWAKDWESKNPLLGGATFASMSPTQRLTLLRTLILWSLSSSDAVRSIINNSYKQNRHDDDLNQPLSVQPWGSDSYKRRYYLIEGLDDTAFRVYRESNPARLERTWWSVAGDIEELKQLAEKLNTEDGGQRARTLSTKMLAAVPRFEATEEKRKRREYRQMRKNQFKRPTEPMFSMYEGRTRGKRIKYTYSDDDEYDSDDRSTRRSTRNTGANTPAEPSGPTITQSGRQVRSRQGGAYGETVLSGTRGSSAAAEDEKPATDDDEKPHSGRPARRAATAANTAITTAPSRNRKVNIDDMSDEDDASEQDYGDDDEDDDVPLADDNDIEASDEDMVDAEDEEQEHEPEKKKTLVVTLPVTTPTPEKKKPQIKLKVSPEKKTGENIDSVAEQTVRKLFETMEAPSAGAPTSSPAPKASKPLGDATGRMNKSQEAPNGNNVEPPMSPTLAFRGSPQKSPVLNRL